MTVKSAGVISTMTDDLQPTSGPRIGTAGWTIARAETGNFPAEGTHLERYAATLPAVEINSSFHRPHRRATYERWAASTPDDFSFSVKIPKMITHVQKLVDADALLETFAGEVGGLGAKLGVILVQLPPSLKFDHGIASAFFAAVRRRFGSGVGVACEPRHATWFAADANACLIGHRVARVAADPVLAPGGEHPGGWPGLRYHRLHGSPRVYHSAYERTRLEALAAKMTADVATWCIFDNTASGAATGDALCLQSLLGPSSWPGQVSRCT